MRRTISAANHLRGPAGARIGFRSDRASPQSTTGDATTQDLPLGGWALPGSAVGERARPGSTAGGCGRPRSAAGGHHACRRHHMGHHTRCHRGWWLPRGPPRTLPPPVWAILCAVATEGRWASATAPSVATAAPREGERGRHQRERERGGRVRERERVRHRVREREQE